LWEIGIYKEGLLEKDQDLEKVKNIEGYMLIGRLTNLQH
jgi:hypothetical protein